MKRKRTNLDGDLGDLRSFLRIGSEELIPLDGFLESLVDGIKDVLASDDIIPLYGNRPR